MRGKEKESTRRFGRRRDLIPGALYAFGHPCPGGDVRMAEEAARAGMEKEKCGENREASKYFFGYLRRGGGVLERKGERVYGGRGGNGSNKIGEVRMEKGTDRLPTWRSPRF